MRNFYQAVTALCCLLITLSFDSFCQDFTAVGGEWNDPTTWSPNGSPGDGDVILIPAGVTVTITGYVVDLRGPSVTTIQVEGTLTILPIPFVAPDAGLRINSGDGDVVTIGSSGSIGGIGVPPFSESGIYFDTETSPSVPVDLGSGPVDGPAEIEDGALPIDLVYFTGRVQRSIVNLEWETSYEENFSHFEVQRSVDGLDFDLLGELKGKGGLSQRTSYSFTDILPVTGINYYRLKSVDVDATFDYSEVIAVFSESSEKKIVVFPNPVKDKQFRLKSNFVPESNGLIAVYDRSGNLIHRQSITNRKEHIVLPDHIGPGTYIMNSNIDDLNCSIRLIVE